MKKLINVLFILGILAGSMVLSSCGIKQTFDKWYKYNGTFDELPIATAGTTDTGTQGDGTLKNAELYVSYNESNGLTLRVISKTKQTISFAGGAYEIPDVTVVFGAEQTYGPSEFGVGKWTLLVKLGSFIEEDPPSNYNDISAALKGKLNLKRIITEILLNMLQE